jgi:transposase-like protein
MRKNTVAEFRCREAGADPLTELLRAGAKQLIYQAVEAQLQEVLAEHADRRTAAGKAGVVRNGYLPEREFQTGVGPVPVRIPKVRAKTGDPVTFRSALMPPYVRKTKLLEAVLPWLYLKGISTGETHEALAVLVGPEAKGLSASTVSRLKQVRAEEYCSGCDARLDKDRCVYVWADGV